MVPLVRTEGDEIKTLLFRQILLHTFAVQLAVIVKIFIIIMLIKLFLIDFIKFATYNKVAPGEKKLKKDII